MLTNCKAVIVTPNENQAPTIQVATKVEWQPSKTFSSQKGGMTSNETTSVFIFGCSAPTIHIGDYIYKGSDYSDIASLYGKQLRAKLDEKGALYIESFKDNTLQGIPHVELGCV